MSQAEVRRIDRGWTVELVAPGPGAPTMPVGSIAAVVPGVVHQALLSAGYEVDPNRGDGEIRQRWIGWSDWTWRRRLDVGDLPPGGCDDDVVEMEFASIDTIGTISIDGEPVLSVDNQFHPHRFRVPVERISNGIEIEVALKSPLRALEDAVAKHGSRPVNADGEWGVYSYLRKASCSFGWDWGPQAPSLGIPGEVGIRRWRDATIRAIRPVIVGCTAEVAVVDVQLDLELDPDTTGTGPLQAHVTIEGPDGDAWTARDRIDGTRGSLRIEIPKPMRWWPRGHGDQPLYRVGVDLRRDGRTIDRGRRRIGLRDVRLDRSEDEFGTAYRLRVNEEPVLCLGANWIPDGLFPGTADPARVRERIEQAVAANFNMLRVWGGGTYESDDFYDACDEMGVMVWQDFMFACATYPEHAEFLGTVEREARHQVSRIVSHPSVVLWCGGNENVLAYETWGWKDRMPADQAWGRRILTERLPEVVSELDPSRPYVVDSPWSGSLDRNPNDPDHGDRHTWDLKLEEVRGLVPRFLSEFGHQSPPMRETMEAAVGKAPFAFERPEDLSAFSARQRGWGGDEAQYDRWISEWFPPAESLEQRLWCTHLLQARAMTSTYEWLRLNRGRCDGILVWQLNDAWSGHSWSIIDVDGRCKPAWWAARRSCRPLMLGFNVVDGEIVVGVDNDRASTFTGPVRVRRVTFDGIERASGVVELHASPRCAAWRPVGSKILDDADPTRELLVVTAADERAFWFFGKDVGLALPTPRITAAITRESGGSIRVEVEAQTLVRDLFLEVRGLEGGVRPSDNLVTLLPGDRWRTTIPGRSRSDGDAQDLEWWMAALSWKASGPAPVSSEISEIA